MPRSCCFEPTMDYVVTKIPRFAFEKFPQADPTLKQCECHGCLGRAKAGGAMLRAPNRATPV